MMTNKYSISQPWVKQHHHHRISCPLPTQLERLQRLRQCTSLQICHVYTALLVTLRLWPAQATDVYPLYLYSVSLSADVYTSRDGASSNALTLQSSERSPSLTQTGSSRRSKWRLCIHSYLCNNNQHRHRDSVNLGNAWSMVSQLLRFLAFLPLVQATVQRVCQ